MPTLNEADYHSFETIKEQVQLASDWVLGGYENMIADGHMTQQEFPPCIDLVEEIYESLMLCHYWGPGTECIGALSVVVHADPALVKSLIAREVVYGRPIVKTGG